MATLVRRIVSVAALLPVLLFAVGGTSFASWRCQFDGIARAACCCPEQKATSDEQSRTPSGPMISAPACCDREEAHVEKAPSDLSRSNPVSLLAAIAALPLSIWAPATSAQRALYLHTPPRPQKPLGGWTLVLRKQAILV